MKFIARIGWWFLRPGDYLYANVPVAGNIKEIRLIRVLEVIKETPGCNAIGYEEVS